jgi:hypothetical protein
MPSAITHSVVVRYAKNTRIFSKFRSKTIADLYRADDDFNTSKVFKCCRLSELRCKFGGKIVDRFSCLGAAPKIFLHGEVDTWDQMNKLLVGV